MSPKHAAVILLTVAAALTTFDVCDSAKAPVEAYMRFYLKPTEVPVDPAVLKAQLCRTPTWNTCQCKRYQLDEPCLIVRWFFEEDENICRPLCSDDYDQISSDTTVAQISPDIMKLFKTKLECENLCGLPCVVTYPDLSTLKHSGVCMDEFWCDIAPEYSYWRKLFGLDSKPCKQAGTNCCPKNYFRTRTHHPFLHP